MGNLTNILYTFCFVIAVCVVETEADSLVVKVHCDNEGVIYIDGKEVGTTVDWRLLWTGDAKETARLIAVDCRNELGPGGIIASFSNGFTSDDTWKCSGTNVSGWYGTGFDDGDWENAHVIDPSLMWQTELWKEFANFSEKAKWIWKDAQYTSVSARSYCRGKVECGCEYKCDVIGDDFTCLCPDGYVLNGDKRTCRDVDECSENSDNNNDNLLLHDCDQVCINIPGSYECQCFDGFFPIDDQKRTCNDTDECLTQTDNCPDPSKCINTIGSYGCLCPSGYHESRPTDCPETYLDDLIASVVVNIILAITVVVMGIVIFRRNVIMKNRSKGQNIKLLSARANLAHSVGDDIGQSPADPYERLEQTGQNANADVAPYEDLQNQIGQSPNGPYERLEQTAQYANADVAPYEDLQNQIGQSPTGPYERLEQTAQYANADVAPYEDLQNQIGQPRAGPY